MEVGARYVMIGAFPSSFHPLVLSFLDPANIFSAEIMFPVLCPPKREPNMGGLDEVGDGEQCSSREEGDVLRPVLNT